MSGKKKRPGRGVDAAGRSKRDGKHVRHYEYMLASPAYRSLSLAGRCLLTELKRLYNGDNNGKLFLSVRMAADVLNINPRTAMKAFAELQDRGFIRPKQNGAFSYKQRHATCWVLTEFEYAGQVATKDFMRWQPSPKTRLHVVHQTVAPCAPVGARRTPAAPPSVARSTPDNPDSGPNAVVRSATQIVNHAGVAAGRSGAEPVGHSAAPQARPDSDANTLTPIADVMANIRQQVEGVTAPPPEASAGGLTVTTINGERVRVKIGRRGVVTRAGAAKQPRHRAGEQIDIEDAIADEERAAKRRRASAKAARKRRASGGKSASLADLEISKEALS